MATKAKSTTRKPKKEEQAPAAETTAPATEETVDTTPEETTPAEDAQTEPTETPAEEPATDAGESTEPPAATATEDVIQDLADEVAEEPKVETPAEAPAADAKKKPKAEKAEAKKTEKAKPERPDFGAPEDLMNAWCNLGKRARDSFIDVSNGNVSPEDVPANLRNKISEFIPAFRDWKAGEETRMAGDEKLKGKLNDKGKLSTFNAIERLRDCTRAMIAFKEENKTTRTKKADAVPEPIVGQPAVTSQVESETEEAESKELVAA